MWPFGRRKNIEALRCEFWDWFVQNEATIAAIDRPDAPIIPKIGKAIKKVHPGLVWEIEAVPPTDARASSLRQFVISADGIREVFDEVEALADAAPLLKHFKVVRFRAPHSDLDFKLQLGELHVGLDEITFVARPGEKGLLDVLLFIPGCPAPNDRQYMHVAFLMLDALLGEYNVVCRLGSIDVLRADPELSEGLEPRPLAELRAMMNDQS